MNIHIFYDNIDFRVKGWRNVKKLVEKVISEEGKISGDLNFILTNDRILKEINLQFLKHNYNTDVISFNYGAESTISGEVYVSIDRVKINAKNYKVSYNNELLRVIIHGVLHLCGYEDSTEVEKEQMRRQEDSWIKIYRDIKDEV